MSNIEYMSAFLSRSRVSVYYAIGCLVFFALVEYFPWRFLFHDMTCVPAFDLTVVVFIALYMRKTPLIALVSVGLLKDVYIGTPPGMHVAIYFTALGVGRFFNVAIPYASGLSRISRGVVVVLLACFPEMIISGVMEGGFPPGDVIIWRMVLTAAFFPITYVMMSLVCSQPVYSGRYGMMR